MIIGKAKVSSKGWVVIPKEIRDAMGLKSGDEVRFFFWPPLRMDDKDPGRLSVFKMTKGSIASERGRFKHLRGDKPITEELLEERRREVEKEEREIREWRRRRRTTA